MARINIEDSFFSDPRYQDLIKLVGSKEMALGIVVQAWIVAQKFWLQNRRGIPKPEWEKLRLSPTLFDVNLAWFDDEFVYIAGSREQFKWLEQRSTAGKKGGPAASKARAETIRKSKRRTTTGHDETRPLTLTPSLSLPLSQSPTQSQNLKNLSQGVADAPAPRTGSLVWDRYSKAYENRYGAAPVRNAMVNSQLSQLVKRLGDSDAPDVAEFFVSHSDAFYCRNGHSVGLLLRDAEKLRTEWKTGQRIFNGTAKADEKRQEIKAMHDRLMARYEQGGTDQ